MIQWYVVRIPISHLMFCQTNILYIQVCQWKLITLWWSSRTLPLITLLVFQRCTCFFSLEYIYVVLYFSDVSKLEAWSSALMLRKAIERPISLSRLRIQVHPTFGNVTRFASMLALVGGGLIVVFGIIHLQQSWMLSRR